MSGAEELAEIAAKLRELGERLAADDVTDEQAEALAREAAELATEGGSALERALADLAKREPADDQP